MMQSRVGRAMLATAYRAAPRHHESARPEVNGRVCSGQLPIPDSFEQSASLLFVRRPVVVISVTQSTRYRTPGTLQSKARLPQGNEEKAKHEHAMSAAPKGKKVTKHRAQRSPGLTSRVSLIFAGEKSSLITPLDLEYLWCLPLQRGHQPPLNWCPLCALAGQLSGRQSDVPIALEATLQICSSSNSSCSQGTGPANTRARTEPSALRHAYEAGWLAPRGTSSTLGGREPVLCRSCQRPLPAD